MGSPFHWGVKGGVLSHTRNSTRGRNLVKCDCRGKVIAVVCSIAIGCQKRSIFCAIIVLEKGL